MSVRHTTFTFYVTNSYSKYQELIQISTRFKLINIIMLDNKLHKKEPRQVSNLFCIHILIKLIHKNTQHKFQVHFYQQLIGNIYSDLFHFNF